MSYSNEIKQFVIDTYNNFYSIKAIQSILRKKEGMDISATTIYRWLNEAGIKLDGSKERKAEDGRIYARREKNVLNPEEKLEIDILTELTQIELIAELKGKDVARKQLKSMINRTGYDRPKLDYSIALGMLKLGYYREAESLLYHTQLQYSTNIQDENDVKLNHAVKNLDNIKKVRKLGRVLSRVLRQGEENIKEVYQHDLNEASKNRNPSEYGSLLAAGLKIFPYDIKLIGRASDFLLEHNKIEKARDILEKAIKQINVKGLEEKDLKAYIILRNKLTNIEIASQRKAKEKDYTRAEEIAEGTMRIDQTNMDARFYLIRIAIMKQEYEKAEMLISSAKKQLAQNTRDKYFSNSDKQSLRTLEDELWIRKIKTYSLPQILQQEEKKRPVNLEDNPQLQQIQEAILKGELEIASERLKAYMQENGGKDIRVKYLRMLHCIANGKNTNALKELNAVSQKSRSNDTEFYKAMLRLGMLCNKIDNVKNREDTMR